MAGVLTRQQCAWFHDGIYIQSGILSISPGDNIDLLNGVLQAQTVCDTLASHTGSANPADYPDIPVNDSLEKEFRNAVGDIYRNRVGLCCADQVDYHTMVQVMAHASSMGKDPQIEYDRFKAAGCKFFWEYPFLQQPQAASTLNTGKSIVQLGNLPQKCANDK
ncbi:hypothetical protein KKG66_07310 [bacterium]|nr:hypothetical protein [bacterium]MBU1920637.1 hypothetical protein [bacterium]